MALLLRNAHAERPEGALAEDEEFFDTRGVWVRGVELEGGEGETEGEFDDVDRVAAGGEVARGIDGV